MGKGRLGMDNNTQRWRGVCINPYLYMAYQAGSRLFGTTATSATMRRASPARLT